MKGGEGGVKIKRENPKKFKLVTVKNREKKKNCNRKIIPQLWICMQQYLLEPSEME